MHTEAHFTRHAHCTSALLPHCGIVLWKLFHLCWVVGQVTLPSATQLSVPTNEGTVKHDGGPVLMLPKLPVLPVTHADDAATLLPRQSSRRGLLVQRCWNCQQ